MRGRDTVNHHTLVWKVFHQVSALPKKNRESAIEAACGGNSELRRDVLELLSELEATDSPFDELVDSMVWPALESLKADPSQLENWLDDQANTNDLPPLSMIGRTVSHFEILEPIGSGGMGMVYKARDQLLERTVALKFLPPSFSSDKAARERFVHEAQAASGLDHPNIASVYEIGETSDGQFFIAMGYYPGETLKKKIEKGSISPDEVTGYAIQLAGALKEAHNSGVVHRDIKPGNLLITNHGNLRLLDFGLAKLSFDAGLTKVGEMMGTVAYMSPEQARGRPVDHRTDLWSLGVVLYEMVTGKRPFGGEDAQSAIHAILFEEPEPVDVRENGILEGLELIILNCLAKNPEERYQTTDELLDDLLKVRNGLTPLRIKNGEPSRRNLKILYFAVAALGVTVLAVFGLSLVLIINSSDTSPLDEDIETLKAFYEDDPSNAETCLTLASIYENDRNQYDEAMLWYLRAHVADIGNSDTHFKIVNLLQHLGENELSAQWTGYFLPQARKTDYSNSLKIRYYLYRGEYQKAVDYVCQLDPDELETLLETLGYCTEMLVNAGYHGQALEISKIALPQSLQLEGFSGNGANISVEPDILGKADNFMLKIDPGKPSAPGTSNMLSSVSCKLPKPVGDTASGALYSKATLYVKLIRSGKESPAQPVHVIWGLASGNEASEYPNYNYNEFSVQVRIETDGILDIRDSSKYIDLLESPMEANAPFEFWFVIDHDSKSYDLYIKGGEKYPRVTLVYSGARYRKLTSRVLDQFVLISRGGAVDDPLTGMAPVFLDEIYLYMGNENLDTPGPDWVKVDDFDGRNAAYWVVSRKPGKTATVIDSLRSSFYLARVLHANGEEDQAYGILDEIEAVLKNRNDQYIEQAVLSMRIHALRGEGVETVNAMDQLVRAGQMNWYRRGMLNSYEFSRLKEHAQLVKILAPWEKELDRQLRRVLKISLAELQG